MQRAPLSPPAISPHFAGARAKNGRKATLRPAKLSKALAECRALGGRQSDAGVLRRLMLGHKAAAAGLAVPEIADASLIERGGFRRDHGVEADRAGRQIPLARRRQHVIVNR